MKAMQTMSALSQPTRFDVYTRLVAALPDGMTAGDLAAASKAAPSVMSAHLAILSRAGLVRSAKIGRTVLYRARPSTLDELVSFLTGVATAADRRPDVAIGDHQTTEPPDARSEQPGPRPARRRSGAVPT